MKFSFALFVASVAVASTLPLPAKNATLVDDLYQDATLKALLVKNTLAVATGHTLTLYIKNTNRVVIDNGAAGPSPGDVVIASGNVFASLAPGAAPVGQFDYYSTTTSIAGSWERRFVATEVSLFPGYVPFKAPAIAQATMNKTDNYVNVAQAPSSDINVSGVVAYPSGSGTVTEPIVLAVVGGTGAFIGAKGECTITYNPANLIFTYTITLLK